MADLGSIGISVTASHSPNGYLQFSMNQTVVVTASRSPFTQSGFIFNMNGAECNPTKLFYQSDLTSVYSTITYNSTEMVVGEKDITEGNPSQPCLRMDNYGVWRFRWKTNAGTRSISVNVKQEINQSPRPSVIVKSRPEIGIDVDISGSAPSSATWTTIGPISVFPTSSGVVWVELHNNYQTQYAQCPCYWDHIVTT